ncbi:hypothetical protein C7999DRAFT_18196, partial [Corynascus novoguineensis]
QVSPTDPVPTIVSQALVNLSSILQARALLDDEDVSSRDSTSVTQTQTPTRTGGRRSALLATIASASALPGPLHTPALRVRAHAIMRAAADHSSAMMVMAADSMRERSRAKEEKEEDKPRDEVLRHLEAVRVWLEGSTRELEELIRGVYVGLRGNIRDGWWVDKGALMTVASKVKEVLGREMVLVERLGERLGEGSGKAIRLSEDDAAMLGLPQTTVAKIEQWRAGVSG